MLNLSDRLAGALLGLALGDALGFVVEAEPPAVAAAYVRDCLLAGRAGEQSHPTFPFGQYSDDTQLARELLLSIRDAGGWSPPAFAGRLAALVASGGLVGEGRALRRRDCRIAAGVDWEASGTPAPYAGNGSAMRAAPLGVLLSADVAALRRAARDQSRVTHLDPGRLPVRWPWPAPWPWRPARGSLMPERSWRRWPPWVDAEDATMGRAVASVAEWLPLAPDAAAGRLRAAGLDPDHAREWQGISAFVVPSVAWSLYAFLRTPDDYWATVCTAIAVGGDTDTMAAIAGAIDRGSAGRGRLASPAARAAHRPRHLGRRRARGAGRRLRRPLVTRSVPPC